MFAHILKSNPYRDRFGRFASANGSASEEVKAPIGIQFVSPNVGEGGKMPQAQSALSSSEQKHFNQVFEEVDSILGSQGVHQGVVGAWADGAENSIAHFSGNDLPFDTLKVSASMKGMLAEQKAVVVFKCGKNGNARMHSFDVAIKDPEVLSKFLVANGVENHTLMPTPDGFSVMAFSDARKGGGGKKLHHAISQVADHYGAKHTYMNGEGEFVGSWDSREDGAKEYNKLIDAHVKKNPEVGTSWGKLKDSIKSRVSKFVEKFEEMFR